MKIKYLLTLLVLIGTTQTFAHKHVDAVARKGSESGKVNQSIHLMSRHEVALHNISDHVITFQIIYSLCPAYIECKKKELLVNVAPGKDYYNYQPMEHYAYYQKPGDYQVTAMTQIINNAGLEEYNMTSSQSSFIYVNY